MLEQPVHVKMLIGGKWVAGPNIFEVHNPACPDEVVGTAIRGTQADVEHAVAAAKEAQPGWARKSFTERAQILSAALDRFAQGTETKARLFAPGNGRVLAPPLRA